MANIIPLLTFSQQHIPPEKIPETPLFLLATAGMRLIETSKQTAILSHLRQGVAEKFNFLFPEGHMEIITGKQEGLYQWLAINYALGKFQLEKDEINRPTTVGAIHMGGASMQFAMEVTTDSIQTVSSDFYIILLFHEHDVYKVFKESRDNGAEIGLPFLRCRTTCLQKLQGLRDYVPRLRRK
jgi:Golgi nucleoside diphosphatase